jgi:hypothetical protein
MPETTRDRCITPSFSPSTYHRGKLMDGEVGKHGDETKIGKYVKNQGQEYKKLHEDKQLSLF